MLKIVSAHYGAQGTSADMMDVTEAVREKVSSDSQTISFIVSPSNLGVQDPAPQSPKVLVVRYSLNDTESTETILDGSTFSATAPVSSPKSSGGLAGSVYGMVFSNVMSAIPIFLFVLSIAFASKLGGAGYGMWILWVGLTVLLPYAGIGIIVLIVFFHSAIQAAPVVTIV
jgi:hypothetical protein